MTGSKLLAAPLLLSGSLILSSSAFAQFPSYSVNVGAIHVNPTSTASDINENPALKLGVGSDTQLGITLDYHINERWTFELVAALPFEHDIEGAGGLDGSGLGTTKHLPPTLFAQYMIPCCGERVQPFVSLGVNYTTFFEEEAGSDLKAVLSSDDVTLELDDSFGLAAQLGVNVSINEQWGAHFMAAWIDIDSDADIYVNGVKTLSSDVEIDPTVLFMALRYNF